MFKRIYTDFTFYSNGKFDDIKVSSVLLHPAKSCLKLRTTSIYILKDSAMHKPVQQFSSWNISQSLFCCIPKAEVSYFSYLYTVANTETVMLQSHIHSTEYVAFPCIEGHGHFSIDSVSSY